MSNTAAYNRILDTAGRLFLQHGYKRTTVDDIATSAGVSKGSVYLHFHSKDEIFDTASRRICDEALAKMTDAAAGAGSATERLKNMLTIVLLHIWDFCHQAPHAPMLWAGIIEMTARSATAARTEGRKIIATVIAEGQTTGEFSEAIDPDSAAGLVQFAVEAFHPPYMRIEDRRTLENDLPRLIEMLARGLSRPE